MALKLPRTLRLDPSDAFVFPTAAEPGEWAVSGAFRFWDVDPATLAGRDRQAFRSGFLGVSSFGWSTLAVVQQATPEELDEAISALSANLVRHMGAPDSTTARAAAEEEFAFAQSLCDHPLNTILAVHRSIEGQDIRERFRTLERRENIHAPARAFEILEEDGPAEDVDLSALMKGRRS